MPCELAVFSYLVKVQAFSFASMVETAKVENVTVAGFSTFVVFFAVVFFAVNGGDVAAGEAAVAVQELGESADFLSWHVGIHA